MKLFGNKPAYRDVQTLTDIRTTIFNFLNSFFYTSLMIVTLIFLFWFFHQLNDPKKFMIHEIEFVNPSIHIDNNKLRKISLPFIGSNFFKINIFELKKQLSHLPWVYQVTVLRSWPSSLSIHIKEQEPIAQLSETKLLNKNLEIFTVPPSTIPNFLPQFKGSTGQLPTMWQNYQTIEKILQPVQLHVVYLEISERQSLRIRLNNGLLIILGRADGFDHLTRFVEVYRQILAFHPLETISYIDLRYSNGMALALQSNNPVNHRK